MKILAIETSCDETSIAFVEASGGLKSPKFKVLKSVISSQIPVHRPWGGVVPNLAKREHLKNLPIIFKKLYPKPYTLNPDIVAVTVGPGLEPALWTGINFAKEIHKKFLKKAKLIGVNHLEGHIYSNVLKNIRIDFPAVALLVSGGHTILLLLKNLTTWKKLGETRDDAVGEVFDKVARMLELPYPGGPEIEKLANYGGSTSIDFPRPMIKTKDYDFSFSGLKTSVLYYLRDHSYEITKKYENTKLTNKKKNNFRNFVPVHTFVDKADVAASFQQAAVDVLVSKTIRAAKEYGTKSIMLSGGVAANRLLRKELNVKCKMLNVNFFAPAMEFNTDNAAMIAAAAYISSLKKRKRPLKLAAQANLSL